MSYHPFAAYPSPSALTLDRAAQMAVAAGVLGTRRGVEILAAVRSVG